MERTASRQDPDVLDTWFSSGLWPLSTLDWPDDTARAPQKWNPTSVLCTAREIITLWVSRMVMFNLYFRDRLPFTDVFIHAMIQDGEGQKMSKSLGNGVDPLDIIASHGADAMRFTLAAMTTQTQDLRMPVDLVDPHSAQTFTPAKIINAAGYVVAAPIQAAPRTRTRRWSPATASSAARPSRRRRCRWRRTPAASSTWPQLLQQDLERRAVRPDRISDEDRDRVARRAEMVPRRPLDRLAVQPHGRRGERRAARLPLRPVYAKACYDFFWRDFCDWYVEAIKPAMRDPARAGADRQRARRRPRRRPAADAPGDPVHHRDHLVAAERGPPDARPARAGSSARRASCWCKATWPAVGDFSRGGGVHLPQAPGGHRRHPQPAQRPQRQAEPDGVGLHPRPRRLGPRRSPAAAS